MSKSYERDLPLTVSELRKKAGQSIEKGAVTEDYPLDLQQAYKLLNSALATEITCVLRYRHHQIVAKGIDYPQVADEFEEHAENEQQHMLKIAERINQLGGNPDFNPSTIMQRTATEYGSGTDDLYKMIEEDLVAERIAIMHYRELINWFGTADPTTRRMLEEILADEEDHANDLADLLANKKRDH
jgi:bacterioferritin